MRTQEAMFADPVYRAVASRLAALSPPIHIKAHIATLESVGSTTLGGIQFVANDIDKLKKALRAVTDVDGLKVFAEGNKWDYDNLPLALSFAQTDGVGFRETRRLKFPERQLSLDDVGDPYRRPWDRRFAGKFNDSLQYDTSLHCAIGKQLCDIHIDEMGFVLRAANGTITLDPDFLQHLANELLFKTFAAKYLPHVFVDHVSWNFPNSTNSYARSFGTSIDFIKKPTYRLRATASCSFDLCREWSGAISLSGSF